ncbi:MAG: methyltransferase domain-containing protein [Bacteroidia bacterium]
MTDISTISNRLQKRDGIWYPPEKENISYPDSGNAHCLQIEDESFWFRHRNKCITSLVKKHSGSKTFWDIGGGNGYVSRGLQNSGIDVVLVEPGEKGAQAAKSRGVENVICSTLEQSGLKSESVESAGMFDVVEHIENDVDFLAHLGSAMPKGGIIYITVPAYKTLWSKDDDYAGHYRRYTISGLRKTLAAAGFEMTFGTYIFSVLIFPIYIFRTLGQKFVKSKSDEVGSLDKANQEHSNSGILPKLMSPFWAIELWMIKRGIKVPFGGSCLVVARKK